MTIKFTNNATTTLASGITNVATSLTVASGGGAKFPTLTGGDVFYATLANSGGSVEIVQVTARSTDTFTIVRGQDGTTALAWTTGDKVELRPIAGVLAAMVQTSNLPTSTVTSATAGTNMTVSSATGAVTFNASSYPLTSGTAVASTSGTSIDFTGIPSWVKRITVMFNGVSSNSSSLYLIQIGSGSIVTSGYFGNTTQISNSVGTGSANSTAGFPIYSNAASDIVSGSIVLTLLGSNVWTGQGLVTIGSAINSVTAGNSPALSGTLDRIRITTVTGTDTFDAGSINILYE